ncbi:MAG: hypothetical protein NC131_08160 [Roseburia sp.]|nr:hypothetical protein [Roseburia sp.]
MSVITIQPVGNETLDRVNKILAGFPGGAYKAAYNALRRAGDTGKTKAGQFAAAEYTISKGAFMRSVTEKTTISGGAGGVAEMKISFAGQVLPLLTFNTKFSRDGRVQTQVKRSGGAAALDHAWVAKVYGPAAVFERLGDSRFPIEQKFGPSTAHMMQNEQVVEKMEKTIGETFEARMDHEILRIMNGWGG